MSVTELELEVVRLRPARAVPIGAGPGVALAASSEAAIGGAQLLCGFALREASGAARAELRLHDGQNAQSEELSTVTLAAGESIRDWFGPNFVQVRTGRIFVELLVGQASGVLYVAWHHKHR